MIGFQSASLNWSREWRVHAWQQRRREYDVSTNGVIWSWSKDGTGKGGLADTSNLFFRHLRPHKDVFRSMRQHSDQ